MKKVIEASEAVAMAARMCKPDVIPMYPITPQTHIVEFLAEYVNDGELDSEVIHCESEHSAMSAAVGASAAGSRTFTATCSQGMELMHEILFIASGMRLPVVMAVANRAVSAPINIWNDHQDSISARDCGWMQFYCESGQEAFDTVIMAYKIAEDKKILLPAMVCIDGFTLSHVYEPVDLPEQKKVDSFLKKFQPLFTLDTKKPVTMGPIGYPDSYMEFKIQQQDAMRDAVSLILKTNKDFKAAFGRGYGDGLVEGYRLSDADYAIIVMGTVCGTTRVVVDDLRKKGIKAGMLKVKTFRPFPEEAIIRSLKSIKSVGIIDKNISLGQEGALFSEIRSALFNEKKRPAINGFVAGLGGKDITVGQIKYMFRKIMEKDPKKTEWFEEDERCYRCDI